MNKKIATLLNAASNLATSFGVNILSFITLPLYLGVFGENYYGVFLLAFGVASSMVFFDFGIGAAIVKYTASEDAASVRSESYIQFMNWSIRLVVVLAAVFAFLNVVMALNVSAIFELDNVGENEARTIFLYFSLYTFLYCIFRQGQYYLEGKNKFILINKTKVITLVGLIILYLYIRVAPVSIFNFTIAFMVANILPYAIFFGMMLGDNVYSRKHWRLEEWLKHPEAHYLGFSKNLFILQSTAFLTTVADKFVIGVILGPVALVYYNAVTKIAFLVRMINNQSLLVLNPLIAKAREPDSRMVSKILDQGAVTQFLVVLPVCFVAAFLLEPFLNLWLGKDYHEYAHWGILALLVYVLGPFSAMTQRVMNLTGYDRQCMKANIYLVAINLLVSISSTYVIGIGGPILGTVVHGFLAIFVFRYYRNKFYPFDGSAGSRVIIACTIVQVVLLFVYWPFMDAITSWFHLVAAGALVGLLSILFTFVVFIKHPRYRLLNIK